MIRGSARARPFERQNRRNNREIALLQRAALPPIAAGSTLNNHIIGGHCMNSLPVANSESLAAIKVPHALPAWVYNNAQLSPLEFERVLKPSWQIVCHVNSIPKTGDFQTLDIGSDSVMVLRDRDGSIRAFHNVCRHRGARLLDGRHLSLSRLDLPA
jgi:hypothetical protein